jgi:hypothetical protein
VTDLQGLDEGAEAFEGFGAKAVVTRFPESSWEYDWETDELIHVVENDPPPSFVSIRESSKAMVAFSERDVIDGAIRGGVDYEVSNGVGDSPVVEWSTLTPNQSTTYEGIGVFCNKDSKWRLRTLPTSGDGVTNLPDGVVEVEFPIRNLSGMMKGFEGSGGGHISTRTAIVNLVYKAEVDNRSVQVGSSIEDSYRLTTDDSYPTAEYRNGVRPPASSNAVRDSAAGLLNRRTNDGHITVDSVATWDNILQGWLGQGTFTANAANFQSPSYSWNLSGGDALGEHRNILDSDGASINLNPYTDMYGMLNAIDLGGDIEGVGMMSSSTVEVDVTDLADGVVGSNSITINWHLPYEKICDLADGPVVYTPIQNVSGPHGAGGGVIGTVNAVPETDFMGAIDNVLVLVSAAGLQTKAAAELVGVYKAIMALSTWSFPAQPEVQVTGNTLEHNDEAWIATVKFLPEHIEGLEVGHGPDSNGYVNPQNLGLYDMYGKNVRIHHTENRLAEQWDIHGFHSDNHVLTSDITTNIRLMPYYVRNSNVPE